jgi:hypothetical protein
VGGALRGRRAVLGDEPRNASVIATPEPHATASEAVAIDGVADRARWRDRSPRRAARGDAAARIGRAELRQTGLRLYHRGRKGALQPVAPLRRGSRLPAPGGRVDFDDARSARADVLPGGFGAGGERRPPIARPRAAGARASHHSARHRDTASAPRPAAPADDPDPVAPRADRRRDFRAAVGERLDRMRLPGNDAASSGLVAGLVALRRLCRRRRCDTGSDECTAGEAPPPRSALDAAGALQTCATDGARAVAPDAQ